jgi:MFS family permease
MVDQAGTTSGPGAELRRGWQVLLACCVGLGLGLSGVSFFTFGVFVVPLVKAFGWTRGETASAASLLLLGTAITAPLIGFLINRFGARRVSVISILGVVAAYLALTQMSGSIATFYILWLLLSLAGGGTTPVLWTRTVNMWFDRARGLALGVTLGGAGLSAIFGPQFVAALIQSYGWEAGYLGLAALILLVAVPTTLLLFKEYPVDRVARDRTVLEVPAASYPGMGVKEALRTWTFWKIAVGFFLVAGPLAAILVNMVPLLIDHGMKPLEAARLAGLLGIAVVVGRVGVGWLVDRLPPLVVTCTLLAVAAVGCSLLTIEGASLGLTTFCVIAIGCAVGAEIDMVAYFSSRYFGMKEYGKIYGWQTTSFYLAAAVGQRVVGMTYDHFHGYLQVLVGSAIAIVLGATIVGSLGRQPKYFVKEEIA